MRWLISITTVVQLSSIATYRAITCCWTRHSKRVSPTLALLNSCTTTFPAGVKLQAPSDIWPPVIFFYTLIFFLFYKITKFFLQYRIGLNVSAELAYTMKATEKCDVYSFGLVVLEVITGKHPVRGGEPSEEVNILQSITTEKHGAWREMYVNDILDRMIEGCNQRSIHNPNVHSYYLNTITISDLFYWT